MGRSMGDAVATDGRTYMVKNAAGNGCTSSVPFLGYTLGTLKSLAGAGYKLYIDGKSTKLPTEAEWRAAQVGSKEKKGGPIKE